MQEHQNESQGAHSDDPVSADRQISDEDAVLPPAPSGEAAAPPPAPSGEAAAPPPAPSRVAAALPPAPSGVAAAPPPPRAQPVMPLLAAHRRARRLRFLAGLAVIVVPGALWAGLTTDPVRQQNFDQFGGGFNGDVVMAAPFPMEQPPLNIEEIELAPNDEITISRNLTETSQIILPLDAGDELVVSVVSGADDFPPGYRSIVDLSVTSENGESGSAAALVFPGGADESIVTHVADVEGMYTVELIGDFSPFNVDLVIARNALDDAAKPTVPPDAPLAATPDGGG